MSGQRLPLAFAASHETGTIDPRRTALVFAGECLPLPSGERAGVRGSSMRDGAEGGSSGVLPSEDSHASPPPHPDPLPEGRGKRGDEERFAVVRHAGTAARAQAGACDCCRVPSDLVTVLRRLAIERARRDIDIDAVLVAGEAADLTRLQSDALADPFVAARYAVRPAR